MIKLSQKRNCNGCKALDVFFSPKCNLQYEIEVCKEIDGIAVSYMPKEECPKPKTFNQLIECKQWYNKAKIT